MIPSQAPYDHAASMRVEFERRDELRRKGLQNALAAMDTKSTRTDEEIAELQSRLERLDAESRLERLENRRTAQLPVVDLNT